MVTIVLITSCLIVYASSDQKDNVAQENKFDPVTRAISIMGGEGLLGLKMSKDNYAVDTIVMEDSTTPFLWQKFNDTKALKVTLRNMPVKYKRNRYGEPVLIEGERDFDVFLDPENGKLLKIVSTKDSFYKKVEAGEIRKPTSEEAEKQLASSNDKYFYTSSDPTPDFLKALQVMPGDPIRADQIIALFVNFERGTSQQRAWVIETYGVESITTGHHPMKVYQINHIRCLVDTKGNLISWSNRPFVSD